MKRSLLHEAGTRSQPEGHHRPRRLLLPTSPVHLAHVDQSTGVLSYSKFSADPGKGFEGVQEEDREGTYNPPARGGDQEL